MPARPHRLRRYGPPLVLLVLVAAIAVGVVALATSKGKLSTDRAALARVTLPVGGGTVENVSAVTGPHSTAVPVTVRDGQVWPTRAVHAGATLLVQVTIKRPGWAGWLTGDSEHLSLTVHTPVAHLAEPYVTLRGGAPLTVRFTTPVATVAAGTNPGHLSNHPLATATDTVTLPRPGLAGSTYVAAAPRAWETASPQLVSWFPAGAHATAVASPSPGATISPTTPITLTFSRPVSQALGHTLPPVSPTTAGTWHTVSSHAIQFRPTGVGYGLGAHVSVALPAGARMLGASAGGTVGRWRVPAGSTVRLQQLLANLGYLPLTFTPHGAPVAATAVAQEQAAITPPAGDFAWKYPNTPSALRSFWSPGANGELTRGAVMAFENDHGLVPDGEAGPLVWKTLITAAMTGRRSSFGYTFVDVSKASQRLSLWHNGHTVLTTAVNTGIAQAPTASGTFAVYEHLRVTTMSGTNPDGSTYHDPGIQFVSYFNGGDALHAFTRAQYGFPQSLGCVEMALGPAGQVWPYTPIGTIVHVA
jgi:peptidoglycan hydrolase-like protein with peptidoglycan-binding domain